LSALGSDLLASPDETWVSRKQYPQVLVNAVIVEVGPGTHVSDFPTDRESATPSARM